jgi:ATP-dependent protease HslVU (ClpYQ) peptidase subunit
MTEFSPREIVSELDRFIVGQDAETIARKAMGIAADICVYTNTEVVVESLGESV